MRLGSRAVTDSELVLKHLCWMDIMKQKKSYLIVLNNGHASLRTNSRPWEAGFYGLGKMAMLDVFLGLIS